MFATTWWSQRGEPRGGSGGIDDAVAQWHGPGIGAEIMGANKFGHPGWHEDPEWKGAWGPWDGLITTDARMLSLPKELALLCQTKLALVVAEAVGHDPIKATGLILAHIGRICDQTREDRAQVWRLRTNTRPADDPLGARDASGR